MRSPYHPPPITRTRVRRGASGFGPMALRDGAVEHVARYVITSAIGGGCSGECRQPFDIASRNGFWTRGGVRCGSIPRAGRFGGDSPPSVKRDPARASTRAAWSVTTGTTPATPFRSQCTTRSTRSGLPPTGGFPNASRQDREQQLRGEHLAVPVPSMDLHGHAPTAPASPKDRERPERGLSAPAPQPARLRRRVESHR